MAKKKQNAGMNIVRVPLDQLVEPTHNPRVHLDRNKEAIRRSLEKFGQVEPLVVRQENNEVIGGNGRVTVMREMGWTAADVVFLDIDEPTAIALGLALNKTSDLAEYDYQALGDVFRSLQEVGCDLADTGWADFEIEPLLQAEWAPPAIDDTVIAETDKPFKVIEFTEEQWAVIGPVVGEDPAAGIVEACRASQAGISS